MNPETPPPASYYEPAADEARNAARLAYDRAHRNADIAATAAITLCELAAYYFLDASIPTTEAQRLGLAATAAAAAYAAADNARARARDDLQLLLTSEWP